VVYGAVRLRRLTSSRERRSVRVEASDPLTQRVLRLADGDRSAFDELYDEVSPRIDAMCVRLLGPGPDAEDAAQQALVRVFERVEEYDPDIGPAMGWILGITAWQARTVRRRRSRSREEPFVDAPAPVACEDRWEELDALVAGLRPGDREVVLAILGRGPRPETTPEAFRKRVQRALERIRVTLGRSR
jgi:DNA-directed RNA polymerase specialized sigma24 family protein